MSVKPEGQERFLDGPLTDGLPSIIIAANELKSPLTLIRQLSLTLEGVDSLVDDQKRMLHQISLTSERALRLASDLTRSVRLTDALFTLEPINPQQLCEDIVQELTPLFTAHGRGFRLMPRKHSLLLVANRDLLRRIIMNFSDNALNYVDRDTAVEIQIKAINAGKTIRLGVRDFGPVLSCGVFENIQNNLPKATTTVHDRPQSSGLGIYIASQFADAMNGRIGVTRHRDGSTFYVDLQASQQLTLI